MRPSASRSRPSTEERSLQSRERELVRQYDDLVRAYEATIEGWVRALDLRDGQTEGHSRRVADLTVRLAEAAGICGAQLGHLRRGALLHDVGKMGLPDGILLKPGPLTVEEQAVMQRHPEYAFQMLRHIDYLRPALDIPYSHHERWDGLGYPRGLKGDEIPLAARLFAVVDVWDALRNDRSYRGALPAGQVVDEIRAGSGSQFDPAAVRAFLALLEREPELVER